MRRISSLSAMEGDSYRRKETSSLETSAGIGMRIEMAGHAMARTSPPKEERLPQEKGKTGFHGMVSGTECLSFVLLSQRAVTVKPPLRPVQYNTAIQSL